MTTKEVQCVLLDILKDVHRFCVDNKINYSLSGGTLLGAIRHNGFIPWDDDADIQMPRPDYERFIHSYRSERGYKLFSHEIDKNIRLRITKICEMDYTYVDQGPYKWVDEAVGVPLDVIPVDGAPDNRKDAEKHLKKLERYTKILNSICVKRASFKDIRYYKTKDKKIKFVIKKLLSPFVSDNYIQKFIDYQKSFDFNKCSYFMASPHYKMGEWHPRKNMGTYFLHKYEDTELYVMQGYDENLRGPYGDYMQIPPVEKRRVAHDYNLFYWK